MLPYLLELIPFNGKNFCIEENETKTALNWYNSFNINMKIQIKSIMGLLCGYSFSELSVIFSITERITIIYNKLKIENLI